MCVSLKSSVSHTYRHNNIQLLDQRKPTPSLLLLRKKRAKSDSNCIGDDDDATEGKQDLTDHQILIENVSASWPATATLPRGV